LRSSPSKPHPSMTRLSTIKATPKFSFSRAGLGTASPPLSPRSSPRGAGGGPPSGSYNPAGPEKTSMTSSPRYNWAASRSGRLSTGSLVPGPGSYSHREYLGKERRGSNTWCSVSTGRLELQPATSPGPGDYENMNSGTTGIRRGRQISGNGDETPGFGSSTARKISPRASGRSLSPNCSVASGKSASTWCGNTPSEVGPGAYEKPFVKKSPSSKFATSPRFGGNRPNSPGPGAYEAEIRKAKGFRFPAGSPRPGLSSVCRVSAGTSTPGPGTYEAGAAVLVTLHGSQAWSMGRRQKDNFSSNPGPGSYGGHYTMFA